ncbi:putative F420-dependent oxidoreductase, MSMEG_4141 family [Frankia canadensis]|uniref:Putative F420-dependent oxidoreductase, MSMEG_4141 family n=1 Tax=Frankia canadensis TaxID=1836972 RepID=A0A2I2KNW1_9ACTN|nr:TIGR03620 family F420-dependent LLM class oxidoreductase [Frankia canadensis]SNQ47363.1 putative F420-dependent oxidoreductase, MSMEG_4141 family [Frankia canadensis]SOU54653.1 putative F420-dependent oxidoreductase, MSMEG_4141 family [Frankia canadensis]
MGLSLGRVGVWTPSFLWDGPGVEQAAELDRLGYGALWLGSSAPDLHLPARLLAATSRITVATGIVNVWEAEPAPLAAAFASLDAAHPDRFLLGLGVSHAPFVERLGHAYTRPLARMAGVLDGLDAAAPPVPARRRVAAALGPRALALAAGRTLGAHPYLVTPDYTASARATLGDGPLLAPDQKVVLVADRAQARRVARANLAYYLALPNYVRSLRTLGFGDDDVAGQGSDRLLDALYAFGPPARAAERIRAHLDAGADHVAVQVLGADLDLGARRGALPVESWRAMAAELL